MAQPSFFETIYSVETAASASNCKEQNPIGMPSAQAWKSSRVTSTNRAWCVGARATFRNLSFLSLLDLVGATKLNAWQSIGQAAAPKNTKTFLRGRRISAWKERE